LRGLNSRHAVVFMVKAIKEYNNTATKESIALPEKHEGLVIKFLLQDDQSRRHTFAASAAAAPKRRATYFLQQLLQHDLRSTLIIGGEMDAREHSAYQRQPEATLVAGTSIRLRGGLFLRDARAVMPDDKADEGR
jgi:hypothetical protein